MIGPRLHESLTSTHNELYGHAEILRRYVRVEDPALLIAGQLQHGWTSATAGTGLGIAPLPIYVWGDRTWAALHAGQIQSERIGAPFLYLPPDDGSAQHVPRSLIAFPVHSTPGYPFVDRLAGMESYAVWLDELRRSHGLMQVTVCLALIDYNDHAVVAMLRRYGHVVATCGGQFEPLYLYRQRGYMLQHDVVTSNVVSTPIMYAAHLGRPLFVGGPVPPRAQNPSGHRNEHVCLEVGDPTWIETNFPEFARALDSARPARDVGDRELGVEYRKSPWELWELVRLCHPHAGGRE